MNERRGKRSRETAFEFASQPAESRIPNAGGFHTGVRKRAYGDERDVIPGPVVDDECAAFIVGRERCELRTDGTPFT